MPAFSLVSYSILHVLFNIYFIILALGLLCKSLGNSTIYQSAITPPDGVGVVANREHVKKYFWEKTMPLKLHACTYTQL